MKKIIFEKIKFISFDENEFNKIIQNKGLFVFPAAPALINLDQSKKYHLSLINSDFVFFDSGYFVLLLRILKKIKVKKFSGYKFLYLFFNYIKKNKSKKILTIDPNINSSKKNKRYLKKLGLKNIAQYVAPKYNSNFLYDKIVLKKINHYKPDYVLINIGGGVQEILGMYLKNKLNFKTRIFCTGAAISFFTKEQAPINSFFDNLYLGWAIRVLFKPQIYLARYFKAFKLITAVFFSDIKVVNNRNDK